MLHELQKGAADMLRKLASKDLREPGNINVLLDVVMWLGVVLILICSAPKSVNLSNMIYIAFAVTFVCIAWCIFHYTVLRRQ